MAVGEKFRVRIYTYDSALAQVGINTIYYRTDTEAGTGTTDQAKADAIDLLMEANYKGYMSSQSIYRGLTLQNVSAGLPIVPSIAIASSGAGTNGAAVLPGQASGLISWKTPYAGPRYRGRTFLPFQSINAVGADGKMTGANQVLLQAVATGMLLTVTVGALPNTNTLNIVLRSEIVPNTVPKTYQYFPMTSGTAATAFATQRKRGQYGRLNILPI